MDRRDIAVVLMTAPLVLLGACAVGPDYVRPAVEAPAAFKELKGWKQAEPRDHELRGKWWEMFNDPTLNSLQEQVAISNQNLAVAEAQFRQARALVQSAQAAYFPTVTGTVTSTRSRSSSTLSTLQLSRGVVTNDSLSFNATWEADVWGRIGNAVNVSEANAVASAADLESARLSARSNLAQSYFQLRALDAQKQLLDDTIATYQRTVKLTQNQYAVGVAAKADVVQAQTQLKTTQAQAIDIGVQRAQFEHAIALLIGRPPSTFSLPPAPLAATPPPIPVGLPSELLERRPDIAAAERRVAAANAQIGVVRAAYFPSFRLSPSGGFQSGGIAQWLTVPSRFWSIGPSIAETLFDAGLRRAQNEQAIAAYDASVALYRQSVLTALQQVEDNLAALRILEEEAAMQDEAMKSANLSLDLAMNQYRAGLINYLPVVVAQTTALANQRTAATILSRRMVASVLLIAGLGGGWNAAALPDQEQLRSDRSVQTSAK